MQSIETPVRSDGQGSALFTAPTEDGASRPEERLGSTPSLPIARVSSSGSAGVEAKAVKYQHHGLDRGHVERLSVERYKPGRPY